MFKTAKIKLTALYLLIIMAISISFSFVMYSGVTNATKRALQNQQMRFERKMMELPPHLRYARYFDDSPIIEIRQNILITLIFINITIFILAGALGYYLAGKTLAPIEEMIKKQKKFISDAAHELKTPLTAMKTDLEVTLRDKHFNIETARNAIISSVDEIDKLTLFINSLLKKSKFQAGVVPASKEKVDLKSVIEEVTTKLGSILKNKGQRIEMEIQPTYVFIEKYYAYELVMNLVDNAIKYNKQGGLVKILLKQVNNYAIIEISDEGNGVPEDEIKNIFEPFYKVDNSRTKYNNEGFGLGLSIVKDIIDASNGSISVENNKKQGANFIVKLPIAN